MNGIKNINQIAYNKGRPKKIGKPVNIEKILDEQGMAPIFDSKSKPNIQLFAEKSKPILKVIHGEERNIRVHIGRQGKHIVGHNNYKVAISKGKMPSIFYGTAEDAQKLVDKFAGKGKFADKAMTKERVNFGKVIGKYVDNATKEATDTTWGTIRYAKDGVHIVPADPNSYY